MTPLIDIRSEIRRNPDSRARSFGRICLAVPEGVVIRESNPHNVGNNVDPSAILTSWIPRPASCPDEKRSVPPARPDRKSAIIGKRPSYQPRDRPPSTSRGRHEEESVQGCPPGPSYAPVSPTFRNDDDRPRRSVRSEQCEHAPPPRRWRATIIRIHSVSSTTRPTRRPSLQVSLSAIYAPGRQLHTTRGTLQSSIYHWRLEFISNIIAGWEYNTHTHTHHRLYERI